MVLEHKRKLPFWGTMNWGGQRRFFFWGLVHGCVHFCWYVYISDVEVITHTYIFVENMPGPLTSERRDGRKEEGRKEYWREYKISEII